MSLAVRYDPNMIRYNLERSRMNVKIHDMYGKQSNKRLFNLALDIAVRGLATPSFKDKSPLFDLYLQKMYSSIKYKASYHLRRSK